MTDPDMQTALLSQFQPESPAIVLGARIVTAGALSRAAARLAEDLRQRRSAAKHPNRLCVLLPSSDPATFATGLVACTMADAIAVPWRDQSLPLTAISDVIRPDLLLQPDGTVIDLAGPAFEGLRHGTLIMMTSGSTGSPKGVALDYAKVLLNATTAGASLGVWRCDRWVIDIDFALMSAVCHLLMAWRFGLPLVHLGGLEPQETVPALDGTFGFGGSPLQLTRLQERIAPGLVPKMLVSSGDFLTPEMICFLHAQYPQTEIHKLYGLTELSGRFCHMPHAALLGDKAAVGRPLPGFSARIADRSADGHGQIEARSPLTMDGYYLAGGTFQPRTSEWLPTGDFGRIDDDGVVTLVGRADDVFKVGGEKVDRFTVEAALTDLLAGREYCVLPVDHKLLGKVPALFITIENPASAPRWHDVVAHLRQSLPGRFVPSLIYRIETGLPRLPNGKLDRVRLTREHMTLARLA